ncbi:MAG: alpha-ketoglutarate-dependent dioxygenase AlkB [Candidatus Competibacteraceae bacterium]
MNAAVLDNAVSAQAIPLPDGTLTLYRDVFKTEHDNLFQALHTETPWQQQVITLYGRAVASPRLSAWYGDPGAVYRYSGLRLEPLPWTAVLRRIKHRVADLATTPFNSALLNLYRDGQDSMGWHSDAEPELGRNPVIASVSLGAARRFVLRHKKRTAPSIALELEPGSVLIMAGALQHHWRHALPKTRQAVGPRINLTFRLIQRLEQNMT